MEKFYTPKDVERKFGIERNILTHWRANLIGPDCIRWKGKILYHAKDIEEWFKFDEIEAKAKSKKKLKKESSATEKQPEVPEPKPEPQLEPEPDPESESQEEFLTPLEVSQKFDISHKTLANWRSERRGPAYHKLGKRIRYPIDKVEEWFSCNEVKRYQSRRR
jgi:hypothetical protein